MKTTFYLLPFVLLMTACSSRKAMSLAQDGVTKFHAQLNAEQYHDIYSQASKAFQKSSPENEMTDFFAAIHRKLGNASNATQKGFLVNFTTSGTMVTLNYETDFNNGKATEQFVWKVEDHPLLVNYRIDSKALIIK